MEDDSPKQQKTQSPTKSVEEVVETKKTTPVKNVEDQQPVVVDSGFRALQNISDTKQERGN